MSYCVLLALELCQIPGQGSVNQRSENASRFCEIVYGANKPLVKSSHRRLFQRPSKRGRRGKRGQW